MAACVWLAGGPAFAQTAIEQPPPQIAFEPWRVVGPAGKGTEMVATFPSPVASPYPVNDTVTLRVFLPPSGPAPVVLALHYWGATDLRAERALCLELVRRGIAGAYISLPYHLERTPEGSRSGALAIQPDPKALIDTMTQAVLDVRRAVDFLAARPEIRTDAMAIAGTSLGAIVASTVFGLEPRFGAAVFMLGGADLAHILWHSSRVVAEREAMRRNGFTEESVRDELASVEPLRFLPSRANSPALVIRARYDTVIPRHASDELSAALPASKTVWLDTGHYGGVFVQRRLLREAASFFDAFFSRRAYTAPERISAPTARIGVELATEDGANVALGLDVARPGAHSLQTTLLLTTRGLRLFLGVPLEKGVSAGFVLKPERPGVGLLWSVVL
ncbi:MAG: prolyl oligopeptidase family serine peptidase [Fimbriimonas ginsengisoli]|uniref:Prolyl oligopeptidase family serine peptidase n=1 Tax=Fimbriimonas ginsengisoli TaxID=1005039 RepID=A0A931LUT7_FIMGI|nr:prolyl oligopeptidase family serine peptidase [Fimbriimonas ginsengisoli]